MPNLEEKTPDPVFRSATTDRWQPSDTFTTQCLGARAYPNTPAVTAMAFDEGASLAGNESIDSVAMRSVDSRVR